MANRWLSSRRGTVARVWDLARDATMALPQRRNGSFVRVGRGALVVTQAGDPEDHVLVAGDELMVPPGGLAVAWALTPSVIAVSDAERVEAADGIVAPRPGRAGSAAA